MLETKSTIHDIRNLEAKTFSALGNSVRRIKPTLLLVHPFYREHLEEDPRASILQQAHSNIIRERVGNARQPIFILEAQSSWDSTKIRLLQLRRVPTVCMIPTIEDNPTPRIINSKSALDQWGTLIDTFSSLGITDIEIGGRQLYYLKNGIARGCVPETAEILGEKFRVKINYDLCYPNR